MHVSGFLLPHVIAHITFKNGQDILDDQYPALPEHRLHRHPVPRELLPPHPLHIELDIINFKNTLRIKET